MSIDAYKKFISKQNQEHVRNQLRALKEKEKLSYEELRRRIEITTVTLRRFLDDKKDLEPQTLAAVVEYLEKVEKEKHNPDLKKQTIIK